VVPKSWLPEVEDMLVKSLTRTIRKYGAVFVKNDMNHSQGYEPSRLYRYQQGLTRVMTRLRKMLPEVTFENCSSGAMRAAAGPMLQNFDTQFISDNASPLDNLRMVAGAVNRMPVGRISHWYVASELHHANQSSMADGCVVQPQSATWDSFQSHDIHFGLIATLTGIPGFSCDLTSFSDENIGVIAKYVDFYKKYRHLLLTAEAQLLTPPENFDKKRGWFAMQLHAREAATHFCYFFHNVCDGDARRFFHLQGLEPHKKYRIRQLFPEEKTLLENTPGNELMRTGLEVQFQYNQHQGFRAELIIAEEHITESDKS
jgi:alpha-galactosidase